MHLKIKHSVEVGTPVKTRKQGKKPEFKLKIIDVQAKSKNKKNNFEFLILTSI